ncbi:SigB/SigF/SigG family RNA polymerase sigma factor [Streptomyces sp. Wb2n-11]|uniref:SigB/SigF/SigG family RNA polymerase sigma factor n=1 Tax=Streptomyces sp. Wb2n-11 TaxID=1030533 RepID=UPI000A6568A2|nr:SigB/SigF/SigG family RNA polymerase sigma factor [Streptomyces sp. Wb2n-11]
MSSRLRTRDTAPAAPGSRPPGLADFPDIPDLRTLCTPDARTLSDSLFGRLASLKEGTPEYAYVRNTLVEINLSLVKYAASRFRNRNQPMEDVVQVGTIGLIKAINRFDVGREVEFPSFALPTIEGEIKRFFRDNSWDVRVPRRLQELRIDIARACDTLEQDLGREPTAAELADHLGVSREQVQEGRRAANGYNARSLDAAFDDEAPTGFAQCCLGEEVRAYDTVECMVALKPLVATLAERDRTILTMRFVEELTQREIGERMGISQMQVSRLLTRILSTLREALLAEDDGRPAKVPVAGHHPAPPPPPTPSCRFPAEESPSSGRGAAARPDRARRARPHPAAGASDGRGCRR